MFHIFTHRVPRKIHAGKYKEKLANLTTDPLQGLYNVLAATAEARIHCW